MEKTRAICHSYRRIWFNHARAAALVYRFNEQIGYYFAINCNQTTG